MNEKIKQLAQNAGSIYDPQEGIQVFNKEKFAQLIIKECAEVCLNTAENQFSPLFSRESDGARVCYEKIKRYFGVEE